MSQIVITSNRVHRALDIANSIVGSGMPKRAAMMAATDDTLDLACAVVALEQISTLAAGYLLAQEAALDCTEQPLDTPERFATCEAADAEIGHAHEALIRALAALGYLTIQTSETEHGNAG